MTDDLTALRADIRKLGELVAGTGDMAAVGAAIADVVSHLPALDAAQPAGLDVERLRRAIGAWIAEEDGDLPLEDVIASVAAEQIAREYAAGSDAP